MFLLGTLSGPATASSRIIQELHYLLTVFARDVRAGSKRCTYSCVGFDRTGAEFIKSAVRLNWKICLIVDLIVDIVVSGCS